MDHPTTRLGAPATRPFVTALTTVGCTTNEWTVQRSARKRVRRIALEIADGAEGVGAVGGGAIHGV